VPKIVIIIAHDLGTHAENMGGRRGGPRSEAWMRIAMRDWSEMLWFIE